ncbi:MAG TPA: alpha/beta hydrolase [Pseudomonadales bacterium]
MTALLIVIVLAVLAFWAVARFYLQGEDLSRYDHGRAAAVGSDEHGQREPSAEHHQVIEVLATMAAAGDSVSGSQRLQRMREAMDAMGDSADLTGITITPVSAGGVACEWVLAENSDPSRRLLYLHGGAFTMGSPRSHRPITTKYARMAGVSVLAVDYRLVPENRRIDCLTDCQTAYRWILANGPSGPSPLETLFVSGDSAGGNLTLALIAWARDGGLRAADGAIALSPATDTTFSSPSLASNIATDHMLGPMFGRITRLPRSVVVWFAWLSNRMHPCDRRISPLRGDLAGLPPTLIHASEAEMLLDDARRYVNKANDAGSEATLETWHHMLHVWHAFEPRLPEAQEAFEHIHRFMQLVAPSAAGATASGPKGAG